MSHAYRTPPLQRFGYRGRALTFVGLIWLLIGIRVATDPIADPDHLLLVEQLPVWLRVCLWIAGGVTAIVTAWWPTGADRFGFMALVVPAAIRTGSFAWSAFLGLVTRGEVGNARHWLDATAWAVVVGFIVLVLAPWPEPAERRRTPRTRR